MITQPGYLGVLEAAAKAGAARMSARAAAAAAAAAAPGNLPAPPAGVSRETPAAASEPGAKQEPGGP